MAKDISINKYKGNTIEKGFSNSVEGRPEDLVFNNFEKGVISPDEFSKALDTLDVLEKGKKAQVGEIRVRAGGAKYKKTVHGWVLQSFAGEGSDQKNEMHHHAKNIMKEQGGGKISNSRVGKHAHMDMKDGHEDVNARIQSDDDGGSVKKKAGFVISERDPKATGDFGDPKMKETHKFEPHEHKEFAAKLKEVHEKHKSGKEEPKAESRDDDEDYPVEHHLDTGDVSNVKDLNTLFDSYSEDAIDEEEVKERATAIVKKLGGSANAKGKMISYNAAEDGEGLGLDDATDHTNNFFDLIR